MAGSAMKPPNILILMDKAGNGGKGIANKIKSVVKQDRFVTQIILTPNTTYRYTVYKIDHSSLTKSPWCENTELLVIQDTLDSVLKHQANTYLKSGGKVLNIGGQSLDLVEGICVEAGVPLEEVTYEVLYKLLSDDLSMACSDEDPQSDEDLSHTCGYMVATENCRNDFVEFKSLGKNPLVHQTNYILDFGSDQQVPTSTYLPVSLTESPLSDQFSSSIYLLKLKTAQLGRPLIYVPVMTSSQAPLSGSLLSPGLVIVPGRQLSGKGRGGNCWLSPSGCCMFSLQLVLGPVLSSRASLVQHIVGLAVVEAVYSLVGPHKELELGLKWPNDIYWGKTIKLGGVLCDGSIGPKGRVTLNVGVGLNVANTLPTMSLNQLVGKEVIREELLAETYNILEQLLEDVETDRVEEVMEKYYNKWLHQDQKVSVIGEGGDALSVTVRGLDTFGYLRVEGDNGDIFTVHDDGNSFDMMEGLIRPKISR